MEEATMSTTAHSTSQPIDAAIGPPFCQAKANVVNVPARTEILVNELAKLVSPHQAGRAWVRAAGGSAVREKRTMSRKGHSTGQPMEAAIGPRFCQAKANVVTVPARTEMIVNEMAKLVNPLHARASSGL